MHFDFIRPARLKLLLGARGLPAGAALILTLATIGVTASAQTDQAVVTTLHQFIYHDPIAGSSANGGLIQGADGNFYGLGSSILNNVAVGILYKLTPEGNFSIVHQFPDQPSSINPDGEVPAALFEDQAGNLYGTTTAGGYQEEGAFYRLSPNGDYSVLHHFGVWYNHRAYNPQGQFCQGLDGDFRVVTNAVPTVTQLSPRGNIAAVSPLAVDTAVGSDGFGGITAGPDGNYYGTTPAGGASGEGTAFRLSPDGVVTALHSFSNADGGSNPISQLLLGRDSAFYGVARGSPGASDTLPFSTVFRLQADGTVIVLHHFSFDGPDGDDLQAGLLQASDGNFYGVASASGEAGAGTLFRLTPDGAFTVLHAFSNTGSTAYNPAGTLLQASDGRIYGTTAVTVFRLEIDLPPVVQFHASVNSTDDDAGTATIRVDRIGGTSALNADYATADGTALAGTDYTATSGTLTWATNDQTPKLITVPITSRGLADGSLRQLTLALSNPTGENSLGFPAQTPLAIHSRVPVPVITSPEVVSKIAGTTWKYSITATGQPTEYAIGPLPPALSQLVFDPVQGTLTGTPIEQGMFRFDVYASNSSGTGTAAVTLNLTPYPPSIESPPTHSAKINEPFTFQVTVSEGATSYTAAGLPPGLAFDPQKGVISGTPTKLGTYTVALTATNTGGTGTGTLTLYIVPETPTFTCPGEADAAFQGPFTYQITATNQPTRYGASNLPAGLKIDQATGLITGAVTDPVGIYNATLAAFNASGSTTTGLQINVILAKPIVTSATSASGIQGKPFSYRITALDAPATYGAAYLPAGLKIDQATGMISGLPTLSGVSSVVIAAFNKAGLGSTKLTLTIAPGAPSVTSATTANAAVGQVFSYRITATNSPAKFGAAYLPLGLSIDQASGIISGTPKTAGTYGLVVAAFNPNGSGSEKLVVIVK